jgi:hypothetical protein
MDIRIANATGKNLYYRVLDYEGPFVNFAEDRLPGMYPGTQSDYTDSDEYYSGTNTKIGDRRYGIFSRYPKFSQSKSYMSNFSDGQTPTSRSYSDVAHNYPSTSIFADGRPPVQLDGNHEGVIPSGKTRDLMLRDPNCNIYFRTFGKPIIQKFDWKSGHFNESHGGSGKADDILASSEIIGGGSLQPNDPRFHDYESTIKAARIRETNLIMGLTFGNWMFMYDETGQRFTSQYPQDSTHIGLIRLADHNVRDNKSGFRESHPSFPTSEIGNPNPVSLRQSPYKPGVGLVGFDPTINRNNLAEEYPYSGINSLPMPYYSGPAYKQYGTYIDRLRNEAEWRKFKYETANPNMTSYNYSDDYDKPILGYFDRRWLYYDHNAKKSKIAKNDRTRQQTIDRRSNYIR